MKIKHYFFIIMMFSVFINYSVFADNLNTIKKRYKRMIETAHPTPDTTLIPKAPKIPLIQSNFLPLFLNSNTIGNEDSESYKMQNESSIAVNPTNPLNLIASAVDYRGESSAWVYVSDDGGITWRNVNLGKVAQGWRNSNDPSVTFAADGTGYLVYGGFGDIDEKQTLLVGENGVFIAKTTDEGKTWKAHIPIIIHTGSQTLDSTFEDKYYIQVDNSPTSEYFGDLYVPWKRVTPKDSATQIVISKSTDKGETWSLPIPISPRKSGTSEDTTYGQSFPLATTGPKGEVYVVWNDGIEHGVGFAKSLDGGKTYSEPKIIFRYDIFGTTKYMESQGGYRHSVKGKVRAEAYPVIAADYSAESPNKGNLYLTWAADSVPNIYFSKSVDGGETWSTPKIVHSDLKNDQFWQWLAIDSKTGNLAVMYFDSRDDDQNILVNCYVSLSNDAGETWTDARVGDGDNDLRLNPFMDNAFAGDYSGVAYYDGYVYPSWVDMRNAVSNIRDSDVFTAIVDTWAPMPAEYLTATVLPLQYTKLKIDWKFPNKFVFFDTPIDKEDITITLLRNNEPIFTTNETEFSYLDTSLISHQMYDYSIYCTYKGNRHSTKRYTSNRPGGAKFPDKPRLISAKYTQPNEVYISLVTPSLREDQITPLFDLTSILLYLDDKLVDSLVVNPNDTNLTIGFTWKTPENFKDGFYKIYLKANTIYGAISQPSNELIAYIGLPLVVSSFVNYRENFDQEMPIKFWLGKKWGLTEELAFSTKFALTDNPNVNYLNNFSDTLLIPPILSSNFPAKIIFYNAAIYDPNDICKIEFSTDDGLTWTNQFANKIAKYSKNDFPEWQDGVLDERDWKLEELIYPASTSPIQTRFIVSNNAFRTDKGWFIDNIVMKDNTLSVNENQTEVRIYPTIAKEYVNVYCDNTTGNINGKLLTLEGIVLKEFAINDIFNLNITDLPKGLYFISVYDNEKIINFAKIIKL